MSTKTKKPIFDRTQQRVFDYMKAHKGITTKEAIDNLGETRLSARIFELKERGVIIDHEWLWVSNRFGERRHVKKYFISRGSK